MDSLLAIGVGLVLRIVVDVVTENDNRVGGVLVGLWEGVVLNHFVRRMPHSFDPYLGFGFRIFVDFLFTQSLSRLALVALWALVGMLLADVAPNFWRDSGLRHIYRQVCKDVRHVKRSVPHIRIKNDLPSVRLFNKRHSSSSSSSSIRSDRAAPSRSPVPSRTPTPGPPRRPGPSPPGTFPDVSGWSETNSDTSNLRERIVMSPGPSPALVPSREHAAYERSNTTHVTSSQAQTTTIKDTTITITQAQESVSLDTVADATTFRAAAASTSLDDPLRHTLPAIPDDWVDLDHPTRAKPNEPVPPFRPDSDSTPQPPSTSTPSRPPSALGPPPPIDVLPDIPDVDRTNRVSQPTDPIPLPELRATSVVGSAHVRPQGALRDTLRSRVEMVASEVGAQIPLPESRATSEIGGVYDQPQPRSALRYRSRSRVGKASSEIGVDPAGSLAPIAETQSIKSQSSTHSWTSWARSKFGQSVDVSAPEPPPKDTEEYAVGQGKSGLGKGSEHQMTTPAQVDPPPNKLTQPGNTPPLLFTAELEPVQQLEHPQSSKTDQPPGSAGVDSSPVAPHNGSVVGDIAGPRKSSLLDSPSLTRTPPPPFTEFAGEDLEVEKGPVEQDPVVQDEVQIERTEEQMAVEEKRKAFLAAQVQEVERSRTDLQGKLDDDLAGDAADAIQSDLEDAEKTLSLIEARMAKVSFSEPPSDPSIREVTLLDNSMTEIQFKITSTVVDMLLTEDHVGPMTLTVVLGKQRKSQKKAKDAILAFARRYKFTTNIDGSTVDITF